MSYKLLEFKMLYISIDVCVYFFAVFIMLFGMNVLFHQSNIVLINPT